MNKNKNIKIEREWAMPNKNTFDIKPIHNLIVEEMTDGLWIDPFANKNKLATITNDLNTDYDTDYHLDALDFLKTFNDNSVDGVLYDPPYSPRQVSECYNDVGYNVTWDTTKSSFWSNHKREISRIVKIGGKVITFGWNSGGIGYKYGFEIQRILLVPHGGWHNDTICTVEIKTHEGTNNKKNKSSKKNDDILTKEDKDMIATLEALPENYWDFKESDIKEYTHGIHDYPAVLVSPIIKNIIKLVKKEQDVDTLFDPFCGSGTVLVEGMLAGIKNIYGNDMNPLATLLSKVKTTKIDDLLLLDENSKLLFRINNRYQQLSQQIDAADNVMVEKYNLDLTDRKGWGDQAPKYLNEYIKDNSIDISIPSFKNIGYWFKPKVILLLSLIKEEIIKIENDDIRDFVYIAFSETIRLVSNRRNGEFKMYRMPKKKVEDFKPDVLDTFTNILDRNTRKMKDFNEACSSIETESNVSIYKENSKSLDVIPDESVDLVITSPPYGDSKTTVAYGEYSRLSLQWLNLYGLTEKEIAGIDRSLMGGTKYRNGFEYNIPSQTLKKSLEEIIELDLERAGDVYSFYSDLDATIKEIALKTKSGGYQFWVVGNRTVKGVKLLTDKIVSEIAQTYNLQYIYTIERNIINKSMPKKNSPTNKKGRKSSTMDKEYIVILRKK